MNRSTNRVQVDTDYLELRGRCKEMSEAAVDTDPTLKLVRGHYICPIWGEEGHWWTVRPDGSIYDPTAMQFPSKGTGQYVPFDGGVKCANCEKVFGETEAYTIEGKYALCSYKCYGQLVGVL